LLIALPVDIAPCYIVVLLVGTACCSCVHIDIDELYGMEQWIGWCRERN